MTTVEILLRGEGVLRKIVRNHSVEFIELDGDHYANFGGVLTVQVTEDERELINRLDEEEN